MTPVVQVHGPLTVTIAAEPDPQRIARWDELVLSHPMSDVTQLSGWARLRGRAGYRGLHVFVEDGGELVGGALVLVRRVPLLGTVGYVPYGPLVGAGSAEPDAVRTALADALRWLNRRHARSLFVQPPEGGRGDQRAAGGARLPALHGRHRPCRVAPGGSLRSRGSVATQPQPAAARLPPQGRGRGCDGAPRPGRGAAGRDPAHAGDRQAPALHPVRDRLPGGHAPGAGRRGRPDLLPRRGRRSCGRDHRDDRLRRLAEDALRRLRPVPGSAAAQRAGGR